MTSQSVPVVSEHGTLPLSPVERPRGIFLRLLYFGTRLRYGKTPTAFRVVYARFPVVGLISLLMVTVLDRFLSLEQDLRYLVQVGTAMRNGCTFCADLVLAEAVRKKVGIDRFTNFLNFETAGHFSGREKAALAYAFAVADSLAVPDAVFARLKSSFSEREIAELVWICAVERYFGSMALPLRIGSDHLAPRQDGSASAA